MLNDGMLSSVKDDWETPQEFFDRYNSEYHFTLDAASDDQNAKCKNHFTKETDGLRNSWGGHNGCLPVACENGHIMVSRVLQVWKDRVYSWTAEVWEKQKQCSISINGCSV